jgi:hypothetical protein
VEGASDAARTAADVVFLDEGLSTIITSIKVARQIFHRKQLDVLSLVVADPIIDDRHESLYYLPYCSLYTP